MHPELKIGNEFPDFSPVESDWIPHRRPSSIRRLPLQTRTKTLNHLLAATFHRRYSDFEIDEIDEVAEAA